MIVKGFSISQAYSFGWQLWKKHWLFLTGIVLFTLILPSIPQILQIFLPLEANAAQFLLGIIHFFLGVIAQMGFLTITLKLAREKECKFIDFFSSVHLLPSYLWGILLLLLAVFGVVALLAGLGFFIFSTLLIGTPEYYSSVTGVMLILLATFFSVALLLKFCLWPYFVIDRGVTGLSSLKNSDQSHRGNKWNILFFMITTVFFNLLGILCLGIGIFITAPVTALGWAYIYLQLSGGKLWERGE